MAEYIFVNEKNIQGKNTTFNPTNKLPIIGSRIWATLADLVNYLNDPTSSAIAGIQVAVVADPVSENNGTYEIVFKNPSLLDASAPYIGIKDGKAMTPTMGFGAEEDARTAVDEGVIDSYRPNVAFFDNNNVSNLTYKKLVNVDDQGGIDGGVIVDGFYATIGGEELFVYKSDDNYYYYDSLGQQHPYTYGGETIHTYIELTLTNGEKVRINADEFKAVTDTYVQNGRLRVSESGRTYLDLRYNTNPSIEIAPVSIDVTDLVPTTYADTVITYISGNNELSATRGLFNDTAVGVLKDYIDHYDCGTFSFSND